MAASALDVELEILIVEDDALLGTEIGNVLERLRFKVTGIASTAHEALALLETSLPRLALIDTRLEGGATADDLASAFHRLGIATIFIGGDPDTLRVSPDPPRVGIILGTFCPSSVFKTICAIIHEDEEAVSSYAAADQPL